MAYVRIGDRKTGKRGFIDTTGQQVIPCIYDLVGLSEKYDLVRVKLNGKWGFVNKTGQQVIPFMYENAGDFIDGLVQVQLNDKWGFINKAGQQIIPCVYDVVFSIISSLFSAVICKYFSVP